MTDTIDTIDIKIADDIYASVDRVTEMKSITYDDIVKAVEELKKLELPMFNGGHYTVHLNPAQYRILIISIFIDHARSMVKKRLETGPNTARYRRRLRRAWSIDAVHTYLHVLDVDGMREEVLATSIKMSASEFLLLVNEHERAASSRHEQPRRRHRRSRRPQR